MTLGFFLPLKTKNQSAIQQFSDSAKTILKYLCFMMFLLQCADVIMF